MVMRVMIISKIGGNANICHANGMRNEKFWRPFLTHPIYHRYRYAIGEQHNLEETLENKNKIMGVEAPKTFRIRTSFVRCETEKQRIALNQGRLRYREQTLNILPKLKVIFIPHSDRLPICTY